MKEIFKSLVLSYLLLSILLLVCLKFTLDGTVFNSAVSGYLLFSFNMWVLVLGGYFALKEFKSSSLSSDYKVSGNKIFFGIFGLVAKFGLFGFLLYYFISILKLNVIYLVTGSLLAIFSLVSSVLYVKKVKFKGVE